MAKRASRRSAERPIAIYALQWKFVFYVGQSHKPRLRFKGHLKNARREDIGINSCRATQMIQALTRLGAKISFKVLEYASVEQAAERERHWALHFLRLGMPIMNNHFPQLSLFDVVDYCFPGMLLKRYS